MRYFLIIIVFSLLLAGCEIERPGTEIDLSKLNWGLEAQLALSAAEVIYAEARNQGLDLSSGPCLSNALHGNPAYPATMWVLDIAIIPGLRRTISPATNARLTGKTRPSISLNWMKQAMPLEYIHPT